MWLTPKTATEESSVLPPVGDRLGVAGAGVGRADRDPLRALGPALEAAHRVPVYADRVEGAELDHLVLEVQLRVSGHFAPPVLDGRMLKSAEMEQLLE